MKLRIDSGAENDLRVAREWYEDRRIGLGDEFLAAFKSATQKIAEMPHAFPKYELLTSSHEFRRIRLHRFPYFVIYRVGIDEVVIYAVGHPHRHPGIWLLRD